jgi:hypothetical protein
MKNLKIVSLSMVILLSCPVAVLPGAQLNNQYLSKAQAQEVQEFASSFTKRLEETKDFAPLVKEFYFEDYIERYIKTQQNGDLPNEGPYRLGLVPGVEYTSNLHTQASREEWQKFYVAVNNIFYLGIVSGLCTFSPDTDVQITATDLYPREVLDLLGSSKNLSNMVERRKGSPPISTVAEMRSAIDVLEGAATLMKAYVLRNPPEFNERYKQNVDAILKNRYIMKPWVEIADDDQLGLPKGTPIIFINTQTGFKLILAKSNGQLKIVWVAPNTDD